MESKVRELRSSTRTKVANDHFAGMQNFDFKAMFFQDS